MRGVGLAVVLDLLAGFALGRGADRRDLLAGAGPADLVGREAEVGDGHLVDRLVLRRHDPLERRVAGLDHTGGHAHDRGQRGLDLVEAGLGLALDGDLAVTHLHVLGERQRRPAEQLGDLPRDGAGVAVGRLGGGEHELDPRPPARSPWRAPWPSTSASEPASASSDTSIAWAAPMASAVRSPETSPFGAIEIRTTSPPPALSASCSAISTP